MCMCYAQILYNNVTDDGVGESEFDNLAVQPSSQKMAAVRNTPLSIATSDGTCAHTQTKYTIDVCV